LWKLSTCGVEERVNMLGLWTVSNTEEEGVNMLRWGSDINMLGLRRDSTCWGYEGSQHAGVEKVVDMLGWGSVLTFWV
jgi:hypothetical protein